jgi:hypothetical protein
MQAASRRDMCHTRAMRNAIKALTIITVSIFLGVSLAGCTLMKEANKAKDALENKYFEIDSVVVTKDGDTKTVTVYTVKKEDEKARKQIERIVRKKVPDVTRVIVKKAKKKKKKK